MKIDYNEIFENFLNLEVVEFVNKDSYVIAIFENSDYKVYLRPTDANLSYCGTIITERQVDYSVNFSKFVCYVAMKYVEYLHKEQKRLTSEIDHLIDVIYENT